MRRRNARAIYFDREESNDAISPPATYYAAKTLHCGSRLAWASAPKKEITLRCNYFQAPISFEYDCRYYFANLSDGFCSRAKGADDLPRGRRRASSEIWFLHTNFSDRGDWLPLECRAATPLLPPRVSEQRSAR